MPRKNLLPLAGRPMLAWTAAAAGCSKYLDRVIISSEDRNIIRTGVKFGCEAPFVRPAEFSRDDTPGIAPVLHALRALPEKYDIVVLLQPTSPLRTSADIDACIELCVKGRFQSCVSVTEPDKSPYWMFTKRTDGAIMPLIGRRGVNSRRQDLPKVYALNGAVYVAVCRDLLKSRSFIMRRTAAYEMPRERSLDIDTRFDFDAAALALRARNGCGGMGKK